VFARAEASPNRLALRSSEGDWTYRELATRTQTLADILEASDIRVGDVVAIYGARSPQFVCAMLGVLRAGGVFTILDPLFPAMRLSRQIESSRAAVVLHLTDAGILRRSALPPDARLVNVSFHDLDAKPRTYSERVSPLADPPAYIAFTSGTTSRPLGVVGTHAPVAHFLQWDLERFRLGPDDRFAMLSGLSHDPLLRDVFTPLWSGGSLHIPDLATWSDPVALVGWLAAQQVTAVHLTPPLARALLIAARDRSAPALPALRYAFFGGDVLRYELLSEFHRVAPDATFVNFYGTTETPQAAGYFVVPKPLPRTDGTVPLGRGIDGGQLLVMDDTCPSAVGEEGEICVRTAYLARGYVNPTERDLQRFARNPLSTDPVDRLYRTGDRGRVTASGDVDFIGRVDRQTKIAGMRVELSEVEACLASIEGVSAAAVQLEPSDGLASNDGRSKALVAFVAADRSALPLIRVELARQLPTSMIPRRIVALREIPLTPNGKVDYAKLSSRGAAETDPIEDVIADAWRDIFNVTTVERTSNFFDLGGDSLAAVQLLLRLENALGRECPVELVYAYPTPESLADALRDGN